MKATTVCSACYAAISLSVILTAEPVHALVIMPTYTSRVTSLSNFAQIQNAIGYVINEYQSLYSDPITLSITIDSTPIPNFVGQTTVNTTRATTYAQLRNAMISDAKTANDASVVASLDPADPTGGAIFTVPNAELQALGLTASGTAGTYQFSSIAPFTFDPNHRAVAGDYDFIGLTENSFGYILGGELGGLGTATSLGPYYPLDVLRYAAPGVRTLNSNLAIHGAYFSIDAGVTNLHYFSPDSNRWDASQGFDAFDNGGPNQTGHEYPLSQTDVIELDAIGYDYTGQPLPEPSAWVLASIGALGFIVVRVWGINEAVTRLLKTAFRSITIRVCHPT